MTDFVGIVTALGQALSQRGFAELTSVQKAILAPELRDADLLVSAQTGSGKTVAFGLAIEPTLLAGAARFAPAAAPLALAIAPTRELALQVKQELEWLYARTGASVASCVGGMDMRGERRALQIGAHIVVGTPGRLRDHIERGSLDLTALKVVILDEADEMLDLGFRDDLEYILDAAPAERRTLMFSATVPHAITTLAKRYQRNAVRVSTTEEQKQHLDIDYRVFTVAPNDRENGIINVLRFYEAKSALVFCGTRMTVNHMTSRFTNRGFSVVALSGELSQGERTHALQAMRDGRARVCIATDVAARGLDLPNLDLVIHADIPKNRENLLHRSGRTGRAGRKGVCALIVPYNARRQAERLLANARIQATWSRSPTIEEITVRDRERMLDDPVLSEPLTSDEAALAQDLVGRYGAHQIAAAFLRVYRAGHPAPEELIDATPAEEPKKRRDDFKNGTWFSLSVGRKDSAEPRWLLPMLCRAGHITKNEVGAIRVYQNETHVEIAPGCVDRFLDAVGPGRTLEKSIVLRRLDGIPETVEEASEKPRAGGKPPTPRQSIRAKRRIPDVVEESAGPTANDAPDDVTGTKRAGSRKSQKSKPASKYANASAKHRERAWDKQQGTAPLTRKKPRKRVK
ncbi:MAG: DEAD/DEAH box helicase [Rhodospirillales bacterium]|jgi:ATP-dependent RNA helicase DeaD|nr:DEAD/DEAH box helicase [Rhodospirillales bacterium]